MKGNKYILRLFPLVKARERETDYCLPDSVMVTPGVALYRRRDSFVEKSFYLRSSQREATGSFNGNNN